MAFKHYYMIVLLAFFLSLAKAGDLPKNMCDKPVSLSEKIIEALIYPLVKLKQIQHYFKLKAIANYAPPRLAKKLKKVMELNYDEEYRKKYAAERLLVRERVAQRMAEQIDRAEQELNAQAQLGAASQEHYLKVRKIVGTRIASESYQGILFTDKDDALFKPEEESLTRVQARIVTALKKCMPLFDIEWMVVDTAPYDKHSLAMSCYTEELPSLLYNEKKIASYYSDDELDASMAHECAHAKFRHYLRNHCDIPEYNNCPKEYHTFRYHKEKQANTYAALTFPEKEEAYNWRMLGIALKIGPKANYFEDNDPIKGKASDDEHPSWLHAYIHAFKIRNLFEAEERWFGTEEANERYGTVYYERAWQKWAGAPITETA